MAKVTSAHEMAVAAAVGDTTAACFAAPVTASQANVNASRHLLLLLLLLLILMQATQKQHCPLHG
jgi:hypothetical protein